MGQDTNFGLRAKGVTSMLLIPSKESNCYTEVYLVQKEFRPGLGQDSTVEVIDCFCYRW